MATVGAKIKTDNQPVRGKLRIARLDNKTLARSINLLDLLIPVIVLLLMVVVAVFLYPYVGQTFEYMNKIKTTKSEIAALETKSALLDTIDNTKQEKILGELTAVLPSTVDVSDVAIELRDKAQEYDLQPTAMTLENLSTLSISDINSGSEISGFASAALPATLQAVSVSGFSFTGKIEDIAAFLDDVTTTGTLMCINDFSITSLEQESYEEGVQIETETLPVGQRDWEINIKIIVFMMDETPTFTIETPLEVVDLGAIETAIKQRNSDN